MRHIVPCSVLAAANRFSATCDICAPAGSFAFDAANDDSFPHSPGSIASRATCHNPIKGIDVSIPPTFRAGITEQPMPNLCYHFSPSVCQDKVRSPFVITPSRFLSAWRLLVVKSNVTVAVSTSTGTGVGVGPGSGLFWVTVRFVLLTL